MRHFSHFPAKLRLKNAHSAQNSGKTKTATQAVSFYYRWRNILEKLPTLQL
ncbi:unknown protein [Cronobacter turicensis z3032]|uniref:Uncharacterized protein n=1 Tax=Cronobacter turicensis (strain DSM 18703 / CCUG 55852 / LMG 23827 / z3032) TaxID=693216 RepID=C9XX99_CROTZ|nr:unknown protein [Cronobacter turicensis z3032]